jgi:hypothetical protein
LSEKLTGTNVDVRTGLAFKASDAAVRKLLPAGWEPNPAAGGPTQGANLNVMLLEQIISQDPEGKPVALLRGVVMTIPAKKTGSDAAGPMVFAGFSRLRQQHLARTASICRRRSPPSAGCARPSTARPPSTNPGS